MAYCFHVGWISSALSPFGWVFSLNKLVAVCFYPVITFSCSSIFCLLGYTIVKDLPILFTRSVGRTQMNEQSSRSHFVFTLRISGINEVILCHLVCLAQSLVLKILVDVRWYHQSTEQRVEGVLNLIDLAGSERLAKSGATGDRLKETQVHYIIIS